MTTRTPPDWDHDPQARERFRARHGHRIIAWTDFCFDAAHDLKRLHTTLSRATPDADHPRAVVGRVQRIRERDGAVFLAVREPDATTQAPVKAGDGVAITLVLRPGDGPRPRAAVDDVIVGDGIWEAWAAPSGHRHYVRLWLSDHHGAVTTL